MTNAKHKKLFIKTWGCQMNVYDSNRMADVLAPLGYKPVDTPEDADMVILNTCHIREKATDKVFSELGRLREHMEDKKAKGGRMLMAVAGCVAQAEGDFIMQRAPYVDMVFGPQTYHELPQMVMKATGERVVNTDMPSDSKFDHLPQENDNQGVTAFLSIQEGCDKFCTFCVVPYTRGAEYSRNIKGISEEAKKLVDVGAREITLLGQNVNAYHGEDAQGRTVGLGGLIAALAEIDGLERIRYTTSHPRDMDQELIDAHKDIPKLMPFLHLPIQSGSDRILKAMNRQHTADTYRDIIADIKKARPDIAMSSDFIVGFPGESDEDFEDTMQIVRDVTYAYAYSFKYSPRPGTPAANMAGQIHDKVKIERIMRLQALLNEQQLDFNNKTVGKTVPVLFDRKGVKDGQLHGRTPYNQAIHVKAPERLFGQVVMAEVTEGNSNSLTGNVAIF
ncbi:MAG: tRNA (N6-isopentenyl adenosine(37)-C2)-methylthiotransferase MiaB [Rhodospirillales bacterium]|nr:tRNA (N6-isopentenyl adenosine(37)-C2)-methylthiotransferase MiaB [Rhodospirillales bacterium]MCB9995780.1 tRNA (N6-isopentenyl adenosine(37)-C2)-methylthiotransferase MiaB [Rhodospirillales bacterium]